MIRPIDIKINAAHPELPLVEASAYTGAPSTVLIRGVPGSCGKWAITAVQVCATFPDNATVCREAVQSANGVWVATLPGSSTSGRARSGLWITASGVDENGAAVTGYILGVADFAVYALGTAPAPAPGGTSYAMHYFESLPTAANEGDVALDGDVWKIYNGDEWVTLGGGTLDDAVTRTSANGVKSSGIWAAIWGALSALPTGFSSLYDWVVAQLSGKASTADATLTPIYSQTPTFGPWTSSELPSGYTIKEAEWDDGEWQVMFTGEGEGDTWHSGGYGDEDATSVTFTHMVINSEYIYSDWTMTRVRTDIIGYQLGSQADKPVASEAEAEALRQGKLDKAAVVAPSTESSASGKAADAKATGDALAGKQAALGYTPADQTAIAPEFDATASYAVGDIVMYNGARYKCTTAHSGAWAAADFTAESVQEAMDAGGGEVKPTRIYNEAGTDALDDKGQLFMPGTTGNYFIVNDVRYDYYGPSSSTTSAIEYRNSSNTKFIRYKTYSDAGEVAGPATVGYSPNRVYLTELVNPLTGGDINPPTPISGWAFYPLTFSNASLNYGRFALEAMPIAWVSGTLYSVGECVAYSGKAYRCITANTDSSFTAANWDEIPVLAQKADAADLRYSLVSKSISGGAVALDDRAINAVAVSSSLASLTVNFPTATSGKARDFGLRLTVASGITTAPELALPQGVVCENADGEAPEIGADGAATILYFTETASGVFLVKGEVVQTIS